MASPDDFKIAYGPVAQQVSLGTGIDPDALLIQWGIETAWGAAIYNRYNLGNIRCLDGIPCQGGFAQFADWSQFVRACIATWRNGYYGRVLASTALPLQEQLLAIGASPWDAGHYDNGGGPGSSLLAALSFYGAASGSKGDDLTNEEHAWLQIVKSSILGPPPVSVQGHSDAELLNIANTSSWNDIETQYGAEGRAYIYALVHGVAKSGGAGAEPTRIEGTFKGSLS